jgi:hypothetical protein
MCLYLILASFNEAILIVLGSNGRISENDAWERMCKDAVAYVTGVSRFHTDLATDGDISTLRLNHNILWIINVETRHKYFWYFANCHLCIQQ